MKLIKEAVGIKNDEWTLFNDVLDELSISSKNKELIDRFSAFVKTTLDKDNERKQKSWERIRKKRENDPNYARSKGELKENIMKVLKEELDEKSVRSLLNAIIDDMCDWFGVRETIEHLLNEGCSKGELLELKFDESDIDAVISEHGEIEESCQSKKKSKKLNETWKGEDVIADLVDRAQSLIDDGNYGDVDDCVRQAIDDGLIYSKDIWDLAEHYGVVEDSELIERYYEELFNDIYSQVEEREEDEEDEDIDESFEEEQKKAEERAKRETIKRMVAEREKGSLGDRIEASELKKELDESITVEIDEDEALDMLMSRLSHWTQDPIAEELYEQMYQSYIDGGVFDGGKFDVMQIVDNDWVNYCEVVEPGDEEHHYDELLKLYEEQGLGDVSTEDVGVSYIEAATERDGKVYFLCRW